MVDADDSGRSAADEGDVPVVLGLGEVVDGMRCAFAVSRACSEVVGVIPSGYVSRLN
jgi:hypothetical protein